MQTAVVRKRIVRRFFYIFWWWYFPHIHERSIPLYKSEQGSYATHPRLLVIDARDHGKSVMWSCAYPLWVVLTNPFAQATENLDNGAFRYLPHKEERVCQISHAGDLPEKWIKQHKYELMYNKLLIRDWGYQSTQFIAEGCWTGDEIRLRNGAFIFSKGSLAQIRGHHPTEVVIDDLEDREESKNPKNRQKIRDYFFADVFGALRPHSRLKIIGTIVHQESLLKFLYEKEVKPPAGLEDSPLFKCPWKKFKYTAIKPDGKPLAPEIWPYERLMLRKAEVGPKIWRMEYMNNPESSENPIFPSTWFDKDLNGYRLDENFREKILPNLEIIHFVDPAAKREETNDYTAIVTVGLRILKRPEVYVLEVKRFRAGLRAQLSEAVNSWLRWKGKSRGRIGFESVAYQSILADEFRQVCEDLHYHPDVFEVNYKSKKHKKTDRPKAMDKESRAHRVTQFWELGWIYLDYMDPMQEILMDDLKVFPTGEHDDTVDALVGDLTEVDRVIKQDKRKKEPAKIEIKFEPESGRPIYVDSREVDEYFDDVYG